MKILIPITYFGAQGGFRVLSEFANNWIRLGHEVEFLVYKKSMQAYFPTQAQITWYNNSGSICEENDIHYKNPGLRLFSVLNALRVAINSRSYDVVIATHCLSAFPVRFSKKCAKKFYYIQAYEPDYFQGNGIYSLITRTLSKLSYLLNLDRIVNSPIYFEYHEIKSAKWVYPGLDFTKFYPQAGKDSGKFVMGCIGRIEPYKGTSYVLDAFKELKSEGQHAIELHIAFGDKSLEEVDGIKVIDIKGDVALAKYYNSVDVIIAPGTLQLGAVHYPVIEAMACKTPVITTGYFPADRENAWIVPIKNSASIKEAVLAIISNKSEVEQKTIKGYAQVREFDWNIVSRKMLAYFNL